MQIIHSLRTALLITILPASAIAGSFKVISKYLDTDGNFLTYVDFEGDGRRIGQALNEIYAEIMAHQPLLALVQMDFTRLFETLGLRVRSLGASSKALNDDIYATDLLYFYRKELPKGLFTLYGEPKPRDPLHRCRTWHPPMPPQPFPGHPAITVPARQLP